MGVSGSDGQYAVHGGHRVVANGHSALRYVHTVHRGYHVGLGAFIGDGAVIGHHYRELVLVVVFQAVHREAAVRQRGAVVLLLVAGGRDGDTPGGNFQGAVYVGDVVAVGNVNVLGVRYHGAAGHVVTDAHVRLGTGHRHGVDGVAPGKIGIRVAVLGKRGGVVHLGVAARGDGDLLRGNFQRAVYVGYVIVGGDVNALGVQYHGAAGHVVALAGQQLGTGHRHGIDDVALLQLRIRIGVAVLGQRGAVVFLGVAVRRDGQGLLRGNFQQAVHVGDVVSGGNVNALGVDYHGVARYVVAAAHFRLGTGHRHGIDDVAPDQIGIGVAVFRKRGLVVHLGAAVRGDGDLLRGNFQRAVYVGYVIVGGDVNALGVQYHGAAGHVVALAGQQLGTGHRHGIDDVALLQLRIRIGVAVLGQRGAVVFLGVAVRRDGQGLLRGNFQQAVYVGDVVAGGNVNALGVQYHGVAGYVVAAAHFRLGTGHRYVTNGVVPGQGGIRVAVVCQRGLVVRL